LRFSIAFAPFMGYCRSVTRCSKTLRQRPANQFAGPNDKGQVRNLVLLFNLGFEPFEGAPMHTLGLLPDRVADAAAVAELAPQFARLAAGPVESGRPAYACSSADAGAELASRGLRMAGLAA
jgi:hypothetical protein